MSASYQTEHSLLLEGRSHTSSDIAHLCRLHHSDEGFRADLWRFLAQWFDSSDSVPGQTSGSTGTPKAVPLEKARMAHSARVTCSFLGLRPGDSALLCMPLQYVGAKMMVVRALVTGLNLVCAMPSSRPLRDCHTPPHFAAMTPMQVVATLDIPDEAMRLRRIRHLIIGGGPVDSVLAERLQDFPFAVWSTYGMTETLSHIALRRLSGPEASDWYTPFEGIRLSSSAEETLVIEAPQLCAETLMTNDRIELRPDGRFRILGRKDNVINSGGIKIQIEAAEDMLRPYLRQPFLFTAAPDAHKGEQAVLLVEGTISETLLATCKSVLPRYWAPARAVRVDSLPLTGSGKPDRATARAIAKNMLFPCSPAPEVNTNAR